MTDEERQRQMDFILASQAQASVRLDRLERVVKLAVRAGLRERRHIREQDERIGALVSAQIKTEESLQKLAESQTHADARVDALIDILLDGRQNGKKGSKK